MYYEHLAAVSCSPGGAMLGGVGVDGQARMCMGGAWLDDVVWWGWEK